MTKYLSRAVLVEGASVVLFAIACASSDDPSGEGAGGAAASAGSSGAAGSSAPAGAAGADEAGAAEAGECTATVEVQSKTYPFTESGLTLATGEKLVATATGSWSIGGTYGTLDPDGAKAVPTEPCAIDPSAHMGALLGSLDAGATWFAVGTGPTTITGKGALVFAANDCPGTSGWYYHDNKGAIVVSLAYECEL